MAACDRRRLGAWWRQTRAGRRSLRWRVAAVCWAATAGLAASGQTAVGAQEAASDATPMASVGCQVEGGASPVAYLVVSPRMPYALAEWPRMRHGAEVAGFSVVTMRDPRVGDDEWQAAVQTADLPAARDLLPLRSPALIKAFGPLNHFPVALVACGDRIHPWPVLGVMPEAAFVAVLRQRLGQLGGGAR